MFGWVSGRANTPSGAHRDTISSRNALHSHPSRVTQYAFPDATIFGRDENGDLNDKLNENRVIGSMTLVFLASIVYIGISYISKFAMVFLTGVLTAIFSIFLGAKRATWGGTPRETASGAFSRQPSKSTKTRDASHHPASS
jgi:hypothetical protein